MKKILVFFGSCLLIYSCNGQALDPKSNEKYIKAKSEFDNKLTKHFPQKLLYLPRNTINNKDISKNDVCFILYEYKVDKSAIDSIIKNVQNKYIAKYNSEDTCLLIVNRFETLETLENMEEVIITDSTKVNQDCYKKLYPIPNFIDYNFPRKNNDLKLEENFDIYVLEAKSGNYFKEFDLQPNPQMPKEWENGFSRGISINRITKTVIYWSIIW